MSMVLEGSVNHGLELDELVMPRIGEFATIEFVLGEVIQPRQLRGNALIRTA